ncbi:MAG TPA: hypothetical protein DEA75_17830, partial [Rhodobacteraceae bacterium]|nr:hypothetical protein [Paracoccaceae bacterium]
MIKYFIHGRLGIKIEALWEYQMAIGELVPGVAAGRLSPDKYAENFSDLHAPLDAHEALVAAD